MMKYILRAILLIITATNIYAQDSPQWQLPDNARMRLGKGQINDLAYSPVGERLAVATSIGIWIYDAQTGDELNLFTGGNGYFNRVAFSPDGNMLISDFSRKELCLWDVRTGRQIRRLWGHSHSTIGAVAFSPNGKMVASGGVGATVRVWEVATGKQLHAFSRHSEGVSSVAFSPDSKKVVSGSQDDDINLWNVETGVHLLRINEHTDGVSSVAFHPDGKLIVSGSYDKTVRLWDAETGEEHVSTIRRHDDGVTAVAFSLDGNLMAAGSLDKSIVVWRLADRQVVSTIRPYRGENEPIRSIAFSPDSLRIVSGSSVGTVRFWDVFSRKNLRTITGHYPRWLESVAFNPDSNTIATGGRENVIRLWNADTGTLQRELIGHRGSINNVVFSPDGDLLASGADDGTARLWDAHTGTELHRLINMVGNVNTVAFTSDGETLVCEIMIGDFSVRYHERSSKIYLFDVETGTEVRSIAAYNAPPAPADNYDPDFHPTEHTYPLNKIAVSPDGKMIASNSDDNTIRLWDLETGAHLRVLSDQAEYTDSLTFSPDGTILATTGAVESKGEFITQIHLWDISTDTLVGTINTQMDDYRSIAFNPDGTMLATGGQNDTLRLWDVHRSTLIHTLNEYTNKGYLAQSITSVKFSPDGSTLASAGSNGTILLWDTMLLPRTNTTVGLSPISVVSPVVGQQLTLSLNIGAGQSVSGYQATVHFDPTALRYVDSHLGDYLPDTAFVIDPVVDGNTITLGATTFAEERYGDGTLATITFEVIAIKPSTVSLSDVLLTDNVGNSTKPIINGSTAITAPVLVREDVNRDGVVNRLDLSFVASNFGKTGKNPADVNGDGIVNIVDLALVAAAIGNNNNGAAPTLLSDLPSREDVQSWLNEARQRNLSDPDFQRGILFLENLLKSLTPKQTALLPNYPNPFNPETWIPYQLASPADVRIVIYASDGKLVRTLAMGHQPIGIHQEYWDGNNDYGEKVASGVYFYTLRAGDWTATRRMSIVK